MSPAVASLLIRRRRTVLQIIDPLRCFSTQTLTLNTTDEGGARRTRRRSGIPMLLVPSQTNPQTCSLFSLGSQLGIPCLKFEREIHLPAIAAMDKTQCIGSSPDGFLLFTSKTRPMTDLFALNPLTGAYLPLPSAASALRPLPSSVYDARALFSPSRDMVVLNRFHFADFACLCGDCNGARWTPLPGHFGLKQDLIFHKGLLYGVDSRRNLAVFDFDNPSSSTRHMNLHPRRPYGDDPRRCYNWQYFLLQALAGNSICWFNTACYVAAMRSFPVDDGFVIGLSTSYAGLSAKLYVALAQLIVGRNQSSKSIYLLLNCFVPVGLSLLTAPFLKERTPVRSGAASSLLAVFVIAGATGAYVVVESIILSSDHSILMPMILLIMVGSVAAVPLFKALERVQDCDEVQVGAIEEPEGSVTENRKRDFEEGSVEEEGDENNEEKLKEEGCLLAVQKLVKRVEFWLHFLVYLCGGTVGLVYANNLGQIAESRNVNEDVLLSISSAFTFFGRLSSAPLSLFTTRLVLTSKYI